MGSMGKELVGGKKDKRRLCYVELLCVCVFVFVCVGQSVRTFARSITVGAGCNWSM